jgi:hypothetical protein
VSIIEKNKIIIMKGILATSKIDRMKFKKLFDFRTAALNSYKCTGKRLGPIGMCQHVNCIYNELNSSFIYTLNSINDHIYI